MVMLVTRASSGSSLGVKLSGGLCIQLVDQCQ